MADTDDTNVDEGDAIPDVQPDWLYIESGAGDNNANSYVSLAYLRKYCKERGRAELDEIDGEKACGCLVAATQYIDGKFKWLGRRRRKTQSLAFPRVEIQDYDDYSVEGVPEKVKKACCEAAIIASTLQAGTTLDGTVDANGEVKRQKVDVLEVEYFGNKSSEETEYTSRYKILNALLRGLYRTGKERASINIGAIWGV